MLKLLCIYCGSTVCERRNGVVCSRCGATYPIIKGVPRMIKNLAPHIKGVRKGYDLQWDRARKRESEFTHFNRIFRENVPDYLSWDTMIDKNWFKGKKVLDAGCGSGRWSFAMACLGAEVTSMDFNDFSIESALVEQGKFKNWRIVQADLTKPPFPKESFDLVFSWGVLHHTENTRKSFEGLVPLVKNGGMMYVMLYEKHNPVKIFNTELLRGALLNVSDETRYKIAKWMAGLATFEPARYALKPFIDFSLSAEGNYDTYSVPIAHHHSAGEVFGWFKENGFGEITINTSRKFSGVEAFFRGEYGGTVRMRGRKLGGYDGKPLAEKKTPDWERDFCERYYRKGGK